MAWQPDISAGAGPQSQGCSTVAIFASQDKLPRLEDRHALAFLPPWALSLFRVQTSALTTGPCHSPQALLALQSPPAEDQATKEPWIWSTLRRKVVLPCGVTDGLHQPHFHDQVGCVHGTTGCQWWPAPRLLQPQHALGRETLLLTKCLHAA